MISQSGHRLVERYKKKFGLSPMHPLNEQMVLGHWDLERRLAGELLASSPENRWDVFERCYTTLYSQCPWLNDAVDTSDYDDEVDFSHFLTLLDGVTDIYEIGSGKARLLSYLARHGFRCVATEITRERGQRYVDPGAAVQWRTTDGVNLTRFEQPGSFDAVISTHVIEHYHPDDFEPHLTNVHALLRPAGRYVFSMPHKFAGPMDLSEVFGLHEAVCMHLREYTWAETAAACRKAGFTRLEAVYVAPRSLRRRLPVRSFSGRGYLSYVRAVEMVLGTLPVNLRHAVAKRGAAFLFRPEVFMVAHKD
ncbi:class I SAM-dependent methyltransferase [Azospirillum sp. sgz301742]